LPWVATATGGFAKFNGSSWTPFWTGNSNLPDDKLYALAIDQQDIKWIGTQDSGLVKYDDVSWKVFKTTNSGIPKNYAVSITIDAFNNKWIGTINGGLAVFNETGIVEVPNEKNILVNNFNLFQNYPNPFNPTTSIHYVVGGYEYVSLKVYDLLANEVASLVDEYKPSGSYEVVFNASLFSSGISSRGGYASGAYFYQLKAGSFIETKKMILIK
jgi:hypothetical protein